MWCWCRCVGYYTSIWHVWSGIDWHKLSKSSMLTSHPWKGSSSINQFPEPFFTSSIFMTHYIFYSLLLIINLWTAMQISFITTVGIFFWKLSIYHKHFQQKKNKHFLKIEIFSIYLSRQYHKHFWQKMFMHCCHRWILKST